MFNGHKGVGELLEGDNGKGDHENGEEDHIAGKGQYAVLKGESHGEGEPNFFVYYFPFRHCIHNKHNKQ